MKMPENMERRLGEEREGKMLKVLQMQGPAVLSGFRYVTKIRWPKVEQPVANPHCSKDGVAREEQQDSRVCRRNKGFHNCKINEDRHKD